LARERARGKPKFIYRGGVASILLQLHDDTWLVMGWELNFIDLVKRWNEKNWKNFWRVSE
jgi:hypothetical protein